jgi:hypothetical protein
MMNGPPDAKAAAGKSTGIIAGEEIGFFCGPKEAQGCWFFDIYIQGSKYNFKS